ncbi:hypothetical protein [Thiolinea disciformis]|uniref:hypothetical protein n=1 Tax=Thiolinea disciformis TaxID=125614 RepID=UPI000524318A|nr:hypothetical protein [Thiolinea disciformis]
MKAIIIRPTQRLALAVLCGTTLAGCSGIEQNYVYQSWEKQAYAAYSAQQPNQTISSVPAIFRTLPSSNVPQNNVVLTASNNKPVVPNNKVPQKPLNTQEADYIANFYGL